MRLSYWGPSYMCADSIHSKIDNSMKLLVRTGKWAEPDVSDVANPAAAITDVRFLLSIRLSTIMIDWLLKKILFPKRFVETIIS